MENKLQEDDIKGVWALMKTIRGFKVKGNQPEESLEKANEPNMFINSISSGPSLSSSPYPLPSSVIRTNNSQ